MLQRIKPLNIIDFFVLLDNGIKECFLSVGDNSYSFHTAFNKGGFFFYCICFQVRKMAYFQGNSTPHANLSILDKLVVARHELAQVIYLHMHFLATMYPILLFDSLYGFLDTFKLDVKESAKLGAVSQEPTVCRICF